MTRISLYLPGQVLNWPVLQSAGIYLPCTSSPYQVDIWIPVGHLWICVGQGGEFYTAVDNAQVTSIPGRR